MSVQSEDRSTIDMFSEARPGRPRTSPYDRQQQSKFNKRNQRNRDRHRGLHRLEVKLSGDVINALDCVSEDLNLSRAEIVDLALRQWMHLR